jgi:hypothetical protein
MSRALGRAQSLLSLLHPGCVSAPEWLPAGVARLLSSVAPGPGGAAPLQAAAQELPASAWRDGTVEVPEFTRVRGMKDDLGLPAKDPRTVAFLVAKGFGSPDQVLSLLRSPGMFKTTLYRFETCVLVYELLERLAGGVTVHYKGQEVPLARAVLLRQPCLLHSNVESLSSKWEALQAPQAAGGLGFSAAQAAKLVRNHPNVLKKRVEAIQERLTWLDALGLRDARAIIARQPTIIGLAVSTLEAKAQVLRYYGFDVAAVVSAMPSSLALANATLEAKARCLRLLMGASPAELAGAGNLLGVDCRTRFRERVLLLAQLQGGVMPHSRAALKSMRLSVDGFVRRLGEHGAPPELCSVEGYTAHVRSPQFQAFADEMEERLNSKALQEMPLMPAPLGMTGGMPSPEAGDTLPPTS